MRKLFTFLFVALWGLTSVFAQEGDSIYVAEWKFPIGWWFPNQPVPDEGIEAYPRDAVQATMVADFDAVGADFDAEWAKIDGDGNILGREGRRLGLAASDKGAADFSGAFKTITDGNNIYILLQYTDDDVTGNESVEIAWAPYLKINAPEVEGYPAAWYARYEQFGAYKATFKSTGFDAAMMVTGSGPNEDGSNGAINWGGTNDILSNYLFVDDHTAVGSKTIKQIITIGFAAFTGEARPDFNMEMWAAMNDGKGFSLDMKVNDVDADDALNTADPAVPAPAEYWWNSTSNDAYAVTWFAGFIAAPEMEPETGDAAYVADWLFPIGWWFPNQPLPAEGIEDYPRKEASAVMVASFDAENANFDAEWAKIAGNGNKLGEAGSRLGNAASDKGEADFMGSYKAFYDESNMYILLQYTDDDVTGNESLEIAWAPYFKLDVPDVDGFPAAWYARYEQFGAYKATFKSTGFDAAMMVTGSGPNEDGSNGAINWGGTNDILSNYLFLDDHTAVGAKTIKQIITIGFPALTGEARPEFNVDVWKALNEGKGISLDMKINDVDTDDALNDADPAVQTPAEYWWNSTNNDAYAVTYYAGFLAAGDMEPSTGDAAYVADWAFPIGWWFPNQPLPAEGIENYPRKEASAAVVGSFDAENANFDAEWAKIAGEGNKLGDEGSRLGNPASDKGDADFMGSYKAFCDESNIYILLQYTDDDVTGNESLEMAWAPYFKLDVPDVDGFPAAWYARYEQFGAYKATFKSTGFDAAMMVTGSGPNEDGSNGAINWGGTNDILSNYLFLDDHTAVGSKTIKQIITIGFPALTGEARPEFNLAIWKDLNEGKGISIDMKINDVDSDDALNTADPAVPTPAEYWWNTTNNDAYAVTYYAGFLKVGGNVGIQQTISANSIFGRVTPNEILFNKTANVSVYNILGSQIISKKDVMRLDLSGLKTGIYIIRANNESRKIVH